MSDVMFFGVLRMPYEMAMQGELSRRQFYGRAQEAADRIKALEAEIERLRSTPAAGTVEKDAVIDSAEALVDVLDSYGEQLVPINRKSATVNRLRAAIEAHNRAGKEQR